MDAIKAADEDQTDGSSNEEVKVNQIFRGAGSRAREKRVRKRKWKGRQGA